MVLNDLDAVFASLRKRKKKALITYLAAGYPSFAAEEGLLKNIVSAGADIIELGIPFSDPIADGPTIQFASQAALESGSTVKKILAWVKKIRKDISVPIVFMSYLNPIERYGMSRFAKDSADAGVSGLIVPDLIPEESGALRNALAANNIHLIHLVAPTTPAERQKTIASQTSGFLYAVSVTGVTGARSHWPPKTLRWLSRLSHSSRLPVCVGFGISGPEPIRIMKKKVDGFIVGSALIDTIRRTPAGRRRSAVTKFVRSLSKECENYGRR